MSEARDQTGVVLGLEYHLQYNHYPPVPLSMVPVCEQAIAAGNVEQWDEEVPLPDGITYKDRGTAPAYAIVEAHHLDFFIEQGDEQ